MLLLVGHVLRSKVKLLQWLYLPSCVIAGLLGLAVLQTARLTGWTIPVSWTAGWSKLPGILIDVVFACLFLGVRIPRLRDVWRHAGPQLAYGQVVAWGQYVVGVGLVLVLLGPLFGTPAVFGGIIPVGFEGGHGTAGGLKEVFKEYGFAEGGDLGLASATMGMISAIVAGMALINWAVRRGHAVREEPSVDRSEDDTIGVIPVDQRPSAGRLTVQADTIESFTLHLVFVALAVGFGYLVKYGMDAAEQWLNADLIAQIKQGLAPANDRVRTPAYILHSFPRFPLCMIGGILVQLWEQKFDKRRLLDPGLTRRIQNASLDFLVVPAVAMISIVTIRSYLWPFVIIVAAGVMWNVFCVAFLARRMLPNAWFERSIAEMGQSMGVTSTGLLLLRVVDPDYETPAADAFAYKQILHEPFMGGGLWTSTAIPLLALWGGWPVFGIACGAVAFWLALTFLTPLIRSR
jgi:ESS family glutamate:Na+ symporter